MQHHSMQHLNNRLLCAVDVETTGLRAGYHEVIQVAILPLDGNIKPRKDITPFNVYIKPTNLNVISKEAMGVNRIKVDWLMAKGMDIWQSLATFEDWYKYVIENNGYVGIAPLAHNWLFDKAFLKEWFGYDLNNQEYCIMDDYFHHSFRDTKALAIGLNDIAYNLAVDVPFPKQGLQYICTTLGIKRTNKHDALGDAYDTARAYRKMTHIQINKFGLDYVGWTEDG